jgi:hypothetical protein
MNVRRNCKDLLCIFWVFPRRLIVVCRRFGTLYRFHLQGLDVKHTIDSKHGESLKSKIVKNFPSLWSKLQLTVLLACMPVCAFHEHVCWGIYDYVCTHAWHACVYVYAAFAHQLILRPPVFHFIYVNTSKIMNLLVQFRICLYLKEMYIHSACTFKKLCTCHFSFWIFNFLSLSVP